MIKRIVAAWMVLTMAGLTVGTGGCAWLWDPDENSAWNNLTCSSGTKGDFWGCNVRARLALDFGNAADLAYDLAYPDQCGVIFCANDGAQAAAMALDALNRELDPNLDCRRVGTFAASLDRPTWGTCLDASPKPEENCAKVHEVCDSPLWPDATPERQCCEGLVCSDIHDGACCVGVGDACNDSSDCCDTSSGCADGTCACLAYGSTCNVFILSSGDEMDSCCLPNSCDMTASGQPGVGLCCGMHNDECQESGQQSNCCPGLWCWDFNCE